MLTEQSPVEVALLCITREIVKKAEEEQPEKKVKITKQNENKIIVEPIAGKMQTKEEVQLSQLIETSKSQEELHKTIQEKKTEDEMDNKKKLKEGTESSQSEVSIKVSHVSVSQTEKNPLFEERNTRRQRKEQEQGVRRMDKEKPEQGLMIEETEEYPKEEQEIEKEIDIVGTPLEESIWAPSRRNCSQNNSLFANIPAHNVPGKTKEERTQFIRWSLRDNTHVKDVKEVFKRGNLWIEVDFDCEYGRSKAIQRISKKESDWYRMIPEEEKEDKKEKQKKYNDEYQKEESNTPKSKEKEPK